MERLRPGMEVSLLGGEPLLPPLFSTQQRMLLLGHCTCRNIRSNVVSNKKFLGHLFQHGVAHKAGKGVNALARAGGDICSLRHGTQEPCNRKFTLRLFGERKGNLVWGLVFRTTY